MPPEHSFATPRPRIGTPTGELLWRWLPPALFAALALWVNAVDGNLPVFAAINAAARGLPETFWSAVTILGTGACAYALLAPTLIRSPRLLAAALFTGIFAGVFTHVIKPLLRMPRPAAVLPADQIHVIGELLKSNSFPSGHSVTAFAFAATVVFFASRRGRVAAVVLPLAALVAVSRIAVGAHWPLDLLAGAAGGWISGMAGEWCSRRWAVWTRKPWRIGFALLMTALGVGLALSELGYPQALWLQYALAALAVGGGLFALVHAVRKEPRA